MVAETRRFLVCQRILPIERFQFRTGFTCKDCRAKSQKANERKNKQTTGRVGNIQTKTCRRCGKEKPLIEFLPGFDHCRECQRNRRNNGA